MIVKFLLVDDEPFALKDLEEALHEAAPDGEITSFMKPGMALKYAKINAVDGKPLVFGCSKAKELLAFLIDWKGSTVTNAEVCAALWEDGSNETKNKEYLRVLIKELRKTLKSAAIEHMLVKNYNSLSICPELLDCDGYRFFDGDTKAVNQYKQNYMPGYAWTEFTLGEMERRFYQMASR